MVKIHIQIMIEEPSKEEWNQLMQLAQQGNAMLDDMGGTGEIILDDPVEESDESVPTTAELREERKRLDAEHRAKLAREAEQKAKAEQKQLVKEEEKRKKEEARVSSIQEALETCESLSEVRNTLKANKVSFKRDEVNAMNKKLKKPLPNNTPKLSLEKEELEHAMKLAFASKLVTVLKERWFNKTWSFKDADGKAWIKHAMKEIANGKPYDAAEYHDRCRQILCEFIEPESNPQRGDIAEEAYVQNGDIYEFTEGWAKHVLINEIIPMKPDTTDAPVEIQYLEKQVEMYIRSITHS